MSREAQGLSIEDDFRRLVDRAWRSGNTNLAIEMEATAYRCLGLNLVAEREARLSAYHGFQKSEWLSSRLRQAHRDGEG